LCVDLARSLNANQHARLCRGSNGERVLPKQSPQQEGMAIKESLALNRRRGLHAGRDQATIARSELYAGKSLIHLERPRLLGLRVDMTPIVKPECHIAILLNLENHDIVAQSVNRSRRDEYCIAGFGAMHTRWSAMVPLSRD
jgi:hypothetical protein